MSELDLESVLRTAVGEVRRNFPFSDADDLRQDAELWMASHPERVERCESMDAALGASYLKRDLVRAMLPQAKRDKAFYLGFMPEDNIDYSSNAIDLRSLLAEALRAIVLGTREPQVREKQGGKSNADPAETSMNFVVSMLDIENGWRQLDADDQKVLAEHLVYEIGVAKMAEQYGITERAVFGRLKAALKRLTGPLNGELA